MSAFAVHLVSWETAAAALAAVRRAVFIEEQGVPEALEWDGKDAAALHVLATLEGEPIGTGRLIIHGSLAHVGRMAVRKPWRRRGVGTAMLLRLLQAARTQGARGVFLNAQISALAFYERFGFRREGEAFLDAGIPHYRMTLRLP
ncbi:GNAT family N-acetyltransferase [Thiobacter aerophilum]|uniref:GNAT family N-acetyltransferase n=1 Tax=Thiobacter aerophilum TaxID=3121275 RepID=A0ABV0ECD2_9BURK